MCQLDDWLVIIRGGLGASMDSVEADHQQSPRVPGGWLGVPFGHSTGRSGEIASLRCMFGGHNFNLNGPPNNDGGSARSECNRWHWKSVG